MAHWGGGGGVFGQKKKLNQLKGLGVLWGGPGGGWLGAGGGGGGGGVVAPKKKLNQLTGLSVFTVL